MDKETLTRLKEEHKALLEKFENRGEAQAFAMRDSVLKYTPVAIS